LPDFPGQVNRSHWGFDDPAHATDSEAEAWWRFAKKGTKLSWCLKPTLLGVGMLHRQRTDWSEVVWVGADEMNRKKGHNYIMVFADLVNKRVLFGTEGKDASVWKRFAQEMQAHNGHPKAVTQVAIDMSPAFMKRSAREFRQRAGSIRQIPRHSGSQ
jgi:Transposase